MTHIMISKELNVWSGQEHCVNCLMDLGELLGFAELSFGNHNIEIKYLMVCCNMQTG